MKQVRVKGKFAALTDEPLADKAVSVRLPRDVDAAIRELGEGRTEWLRRVISEAAKAELMK